MTIQQWLFSFNGRIGRRDFWIWIGVWLIALIILFTLAGAEIMPYSTAGFFLSGSLIPTAAVIVKRLHDRNKKVGGRCCLFLHGCCWPATGKHSALWHNGGSGVLFRH